MIKNIQIARNFFVKSYLQSLIMESLSSGKTKSLKDISDYSKRNYNKEIYYGTAVYKFHFALIELVQMGFVELIDVAPDINMINQDCSCHITEEGYEAYKNQLFQNKAASIFYGWRTYCLTLVIIGISILSIFLSLFSLFK